MDNKPKMETGHPDKAHFLLSRIHSYLLGFDCSREKYEKGLFPH